MQKSGINYAFLHLEFLLVSWREVFVIKGRRFHWARRALLCPLFHLPSGQRPTAWGWPLQEVSLKRKMRKAGQALSNALRWSQEKAAVSSLSGYFFSLVLWPPHTHPPPPPLSWWLRAEIWACCHICLSVCLMLFFSESFRGQLPIVSCWEQRLFLVSS